jgi:triacylglycerol lipase
VDTDQLTDLTLTAAIAAGGVVVVFRVGVLLFISFGHVRYSQWARHKGQAVPIAGLALLAWFWRESSAISTVVFDRLRCAFGAGSALARTHGERPVVLVHGFTQDGSNWLRLRKQLEADGRWTLAPSLGRPFAEGLRRYETPVEAALELAAEGSDDPISIVAHSMGGIVVRQVLQRRPDLAARVGLVLTLGAPHAGTAAARGIKHVPEARVLHRRSEALAALPTLRELVPRARVVTVAARLDHLVYPTETAHHGSPDSTTLERPGHVGLLVAPEVRERVLDILSEPLPPR